MQKYENFTRFLRTFAKINIKSITMADKDTCNLILADCPPDELKDLQSGLEDSTGCEFSIISVQSNKLHGSIIKKLKRYLSYFNLPLSLIPKRKTIGTIIGWQQFHAINYSFFLRLFRLKKQGRIIVANFTYKKKNGLSGILYRWYMRFAVSGNYIDAIHVPSREYAREVSDLFNFDITKIIVCCFGTPDRMEEWQNLDCPYSNFAVAVGRSNRDFDLLARIWDRTEIKNSGTKLIIISDTWQPTVKITDNPAIIHLTDIKGEASYPFFAKCDFSLVPLMESNICSGDTVLLNSMMMLKPVVITSPSTLAEMYVTDGVNGLCIPKTEEAAAEKILHLICDKQYRDSLGQRARTSYLSSYSRKQMGKNLGSYIAQL